MKEGAQIRWMRTMQPVDVLKKRYDMCACMIEQQSQRRFLHCLGPLGSDDQVCLLAGALKAGAYGLHN